MAPPELLADRFRIVREVGRGGMGVVYEAVDEHTGGRVAAKQMLAGGADEVRFAREAELLADIHDSGLVRYVAHGTTRGGHPYLVMEWLDGLDLSVLLERGPLGVDDALALAARVAGALGALHARSVIHRDVKPSNIFLVGGSVGQAKVLDLGIARPLARDTRLTRTGAAIGTPAYMAPEQARGEAVDARADVFSLGCVLYECIAGHPPFRGDNPLAVLMRIVVEEPPGLDEVAGVAAPVAELVARMLDKRADARPAQGDAVREAIADVLRKTGSAPPPRTSGLSAAERRVVSLVVTGGAHATDATLLPEERFDLEERARAAVAERSGELQILAGGATVATPVRLAAPTDQAACAARCALALAEVLEGVPIAVVTGRAVVGGRLPIGDAIDRAVGFVGGDRQRIRIDEPTASLLGPRFEIEGAEGERWLVRERELVDPARRLLGKPTPFVGRDKELASLLATLDECAGESVARAVLVTAAAGTGKSRLMKEFLRSASMRHATLEVFMARGDSLGAGSPLGMAGQVIRRAAGMADREPVEAKAAKLASRIERLAPDAGAGPRGATPVVRLEFLREIAGLPVAIADASDALRGARQDAVAMGDAVRTAWESWLDAECVGGPRVLVLEDLHWGDLSTVRLVDGALKNLHDRPLLVVATARPEVHEAFPSLWPDRDVSVLRLGAVSKSASERLVHEVLGRDADPAVLHTILDRAAGHPFLLEELIRAVAEGRAGDPIPDSVLGMVQLRLDALAPDVRRALRAASVFGETFRRSGVAALLEEDADDLLRAFAELERKEFVTRVVGSTSGGDEYAFRHALVRDAAYAMLTDADRTTAHALAGGWLEGAGGHDALVLAEHFDRGGVLGRAIGWYRRAAEQALEGSDPAGAIERAERAIACGADGEVRGMLERVCAEAHTWRGDLGRARSSAEAAISHLPERSEVWFHAVAALIFAAGQAGDNDTAEAWGRRAAALDVPDDARSAAVVCICHAVNQIVYVNRELAVAELSRRVDELARDPERLEPLALGWVHRIGVLSGMLSLRPGRARVHVEAAIASFERAGARRLVCMMRIFRACGTVALDPERAFADMADALHVAERLGATFVVGLGRMYTLYLLLSSGRFTEVEVRTAELADAFRGNPRVRVAVLWYRVQALAMLGKTGPLREAVRDPELSALFGATDLGGASILSLGAHAAALEGDLDEARAFAARARALMPPGPYVRAPSGGGGLDTDWALATGFAAVGDEETARGILGPTLEAIRAAAADFDDPMERAALLASPHPWRAILELAAGLGLRL